MTADSGFQDTNWDGLERRTIPVLPAGGAGGGIPIALLQYLDARLNAHMARYETMMREHTVEEMERYQRIETAVQSAAAASEARHVMLTQQILAGSQRADLVEAAFARDEQGKPDYAGHRGDHTSRKKLGEWIGATKRSVLAKVLEWAAVVLIAAIVFKVAPQLLGPIFTPGM